MEQNQLENLLISSGLGKKEARIYLFLLEHGPSKALPIFKSLAMKKGNTYALLESLVTKGFVQKSATLFSPQPPTAILQRLEDKSKAMISSLETMKTVLPQLSSQYKLAVGKPTIRYYEGVEGLKEVFRDIYAPKKEPVYGAIDVDQIESVLSGFSEGQLIPSRIKSKLAVKVLFNTTPFARELHKRDTHENRESILLDSDQYPLPAEIESYEDKVALMSFKKGDFLGLIIQNEDFAITLRSILKFLFDHIRDCPGSQEVKKQGT